VFGFCNFLGRIGGFFAPIVSEIITGDPYFIFIGGSILGILQV